MEVSIGEFKSPEWPDLCSLRLGGNHETARTRASWRSPSHVMSHRASYWSEDRARWKSSVAHKYTVRVAMSSDLSDSIPGFQGSSPPLSLSLFERDDWRKFRAYFYPSQVGRSWFWEPIVQGTVYRPQSI